LVAFKKIALFVFLTGNSCLFAQTDSLYKIFVNRKLHDTVRLNAIQDLTWEVVFIDPAKAKKYSHLQIEFARKAKNKKFEARAYNSLGVASHLQGDFIQAVKFHKKALSIRLAIKDKMGISGSYSNIGSAFEGLSDFTQALDYYLKSLKIEEEINNQEGLCQSYNNIGLIYESIAQEAADTSGYHTALKYYFKSLKISRKLKNTDLEAAALGNIGNVYYSFKEYEKSLNYQKECLRLFKKGNKLMGLISSYGNMGNAYLNFDDDKLVEYDLTRIGKYELAYKYYDSCYAIASKIQDQKGMALSLDNKGNINYKLGKFEEARKMLHEAATMFREMGDPDDERTCHELLYVIYKAMNRPSEALKHFELYTSLKDSIYKAENQLAITSKQLSFDYARRSSIDSLKRVEERTIVKEQLKYEQKTRYYLYGGLALVVFFSIFIFNRFRVTKKQKVIIEEQKIIVETRNKEVTDSILYAKRIQDAMLPSKKYIDRNLKKLLEKK
jgi:tetratricopeptide (TPR) repeat protein